MIEKYSRALVTFLCVFNCLHSGTGSKLNVTKLDCGMRHLALDYARALVTNQLVFDQIYDALRLDDLCEFDNKTLQVARETQRRMEDLKPEHCIGSCIYVTASEVTVGIPNGSFDRPHASIHDAIAHSRSSNITSPTIVLREGIHSLHAKTLSLTSEDKGLSIIGLKGESVWVSGGLAVDVDFEAVDNGLFVANLTTLLSEHKELPSLVSLFTTSRRYTRARYPNSDPEVDQWGYASHNRLNYSISAEHVLEWHRPKASSTPNFTFVDFSKNPPPGVPFKNDSAQEGYNWYTSGHGGACSDVWGASADSYWCSNATQGGWAEVDAACAATGQVQIPVGMTYNTSSILKRFQNVSLAGAIIHAWHSQSWAMHMFEITNQSSHGEIAFAKGGGRQGGRNWCRCDQCTYAAFWCGQHQKPPWKDTRMISGSWMVENLIDELDIPGEYYFDQQSHLLYLKPNSTVDLNDFKIGILDRLIDLRNTSDITIANVGFRDTAPTYMSDWSPPSGGDWSLHRGGAVFMENVSNVKISDCKFSRLDGNAVFLSRKTRNVTIEGSIFEWLGENAIATWGDTDHFDATAENFPMFTTIQRNVFREVGIYQKQSSAVGQCKAALTTIRDNIMFNMPRAAVNFNDMVGGGDVVERNLIFNTCRESGDHGPINTWDRQPFLTTLRDGVTKSFDPIPRTIRNNFIIANYGASQGVDNDDGSSWYHIYKNLWYSSMGFKMDYGGHDSIFEDNLVLAFPYDAQQCFDLASFVEGHGHQVRRNRCLIGLGNKMGSGCGDPSCASSIPETKDSLELVGTLWTSCGDSTLRISSNEYYTVDGEANIQFEDGTFSLEEAQKKCGIEEGSTSSKLPGEDTVLMWGKEMVDEMKAGQQELSVSIE